MQQAHAEGPALLVADNKTGYYGVHLAKSWWQASTSRGGKPYQAQVWRGGKNASLGHFATAEEAASRGRRRGRRRRSAQRRRRR